MISLIIDQCFKENWFKLIIIESLIYIVPWTNQMSPQSPGFVSKLHLEEDCIISFSNTFSLVDNSENIYPVGIY